MYKFALDDVTENDIHALRYIYFVREISEILQKILAISIAYIFILTVEFIFPKQSMKIGQTYNLDLHPHPMA